MNRRDLQRSKFIKAPETGETLARISVEAGGIIVHFWSKKRKAEVSVPLTDLMHLALSAVCEEQVEVGGASTARAGEPV